MYESTLPLGGPHWGPGGALAWIESDVQNRGGRLNILDSGGNHSSRDLGLSIAGINSWGRNGLIALVDDPLGVNRGYVLDPASEERRALSTGWVGLAWSPDGASLLVAHGRAIGIINDLTNLSKVERIGTIDEPAYAGAWAG